MGPPSGASEGEVQLRNRQHRVVADLGCRALQGDEPEWLMHDASSAVAETLDADYVGVFVLAPDGRRLRLREGVGWRETEGHVGGPAEPEHLGGPVLADAEAAVFGPEDRPIPRSDRLVRHDVASGVAVPLTPTGDPVGLLGVYDTEERAFSDADVAFLQSVANVLAPLVDRDRASGEPVRPAPLLDRIVETSPMGLVVFDEDGRLQYANDRAAEVLGFGHEELDGIAYDDPRLAMVDANGDPLSTARMPFRRVMEAGERVLDMEIGIGQPGKRTWLTMNGAPLEEERPEAGAVFAFADVTERRRLERQLQEMLERVTDAFYALDEDFRFTHVNEAATEFLQRSEEELSGESLWDLYPEAAEIDDVWNAFHHAMEEQETTSFEVYYPPLDFWVDATIYPSESGVSVYFQDVTERKERERELRRSRERYRSLTEDVLDTSDVGTLILDDEFHIVWANRRIAEFLDVDRDELLGADKRERLWADFRHLFEDPDRFEERVLAAYEDNTYIENFECHIVPEDGHPERWLEHWSKPIGSGLFEGGRIEHYYDITDRKIQERELRESEAKFRTLTENLSEVVWMTSADPMDMLYINLTFEEVWGIERETLYEDTARFLEGIHPGDRDRVREAYTALPEQDYDEEYRVVQADGEVRWVHARAVPVTDDEGEVFRIVGIAEDVTERREFEARLAASERKHRTLVENFPNGAVGMFDGDLRYTVVGGQLLDDLGLDSDEIVGQSVLDRYPDGVLEVAETHFRSALEGEASRFEITFHGRELLAHTIPVRDAEGEVYAGMLVVQDITDRKQAEEELRESEALYRTLAENFPNGGIGVYDHDLRYTLVEGTMWDDIEPDAEDLEGKTIHEALPPETAEDVEGIFQAALEGEKGTVVSELGGRTYRVWATPLRSDAEVTGGLSFALDVTDQLARQRELEESRRQYQTLVENFPNGAVALVDKDIRYRMVGGETPETVEATTDELQGQRVEEAFPDPQASQMASNYRAAFEEGERSSFEQHLGDSVYRFHVVPVRDEDGEVFAAMGMSQDVTELKERQRRLEESNQRLEQFAYAASHDLQEPLRMVSTYLQLIEERYGEHLDEEGREFFAFAVDGAKRMREMIRSLLAYSRITRQGQPLEPVDAGAVVEDVLSDLRLQIEETDAEVTVADLPRVEADPDQLAQVFRNLVSNALTYSGDEPPRVHVDAEPTDGRWRFAVEDQGVGIPAAQTDRIFEVFRRLGDREEGGSGTGVGLAICQQIVDRHDGRLWVESEPGEGSTFYFTMPTVETEG